MKYLAPLAVAALLAGCSSESNVDYTLRASDLGDAWPLSVSEGKLMCLSGNRLVLSTKTGRYALNGAAAPRPGDKWESIEPIWLPGEYEGTRKDIRPLIDLAIERCTQAGQWKFEQVSFN